MLQKSILYSILFLKCPQCRQGEFLEAHPYQISNRNHLRTRCPRCNLKYAMKPSFYNGSMYVSYVVGIVFTTAAYLISLILGLADSPLLIFMIMVLNLAAFFPYIGAVSKSIWAHLFIKFNAAIAHKVKNDSGT